jgi:hypothetical protein
MIKRFLSAILASVVFATTAMASTVSGESAYCLANCVNGVCIPVVAALGAVNYPIGAPLLVTSFGLGGSGFQAAYAYAWAKTGVPDGAATNISGLSTDSTNTFTFGQITDADAGLYVEIGYATNGSTAVNWCVTVNP